MFLRPLLILGAFALSGCASGYDSISQLEQKSDWQVRSFSDTATPSLAAYRPMAGAGELWVFIEGDGRAWVTPRQISTDPTPQNPVALKLAMQPTAASVLYLGRPCQYLRLLNGPCPNDLWSLSRYSDAAVQQLDRVLTDYVTQARAKRIILVGYSGGGVMATLVAARRTDISAMITLAGNLSVSAWTSYHRISPLTGSLDPTQQPQRLATIPQVHVVGGQDTVVPPAIVEDYMSHLPRPHRAYMKVETGFSHDCCWADQWPRLRQDALTLISATQSAQSAPSMKSSEYP